jgi:hypothetical protein
MATKHDLQAWLIDALRSAGGASTIPEACAHIWRAHQDDLRGSGDLFYTWQYDVRWAAYRLRRQGRLRDVADSPRGVWELT